MLGTGKDIDFLLSFMSIEFFPQPFLYVLWLLITYSNYTAMTWTVQKKKEML